MMKIIRNYLIAQLIIFLIPLIIFMMLIMSAFGGSSSNDDITRPSTLSMYVESYREYVTLSAKSEQMEPYINLILAVMQVESNGMGSDPMQSSEGPFNERYPNIPGGIIDPYYSIDCGIKELKSCLNQAEVKDPNDLEKIKAALGGYNFGNGFIGWLKENHGGTWSLDAANEFSQMMAQRLGWSAYGDPPYANKVMNYYSIDGFIIGEGKFMQPIRGAVATSRFGGGHYGLDIDGGYGAQIFAPIDAKVYAVSTKCEPSGGYLGNKCPVNDHATGGGNYVQLQVQYQEEVLYILLCHMKVVYVSAGQEVKQGQVLGEQGHSGNSTASHLHIEMHKGSPDGIGTEAGILDPSLYITY